MTDEELLKRVAEIEGWEVDSHGWVWLPCGVWVNSANDVTWSDLGPLIEKYKVDIQWAHEANGVDIHWEAKAGMAKSWVYHESLPHAILLAIVEAESG